MISKRIAIDLRHPSHSNASAPRTRGPGDGRLVIFQVHGPSFQQRQVMRVEDWHLIVDDVFDIPIDREALRFITTFDRFGNQLICLLIAEARLLLGQR